MSDFLQSFSSEGLGTWWFGFFYSLPIALVDSLIWNDLLSAQIVNILLFNLSGFLLWKISRKYLSEMYSYGVVILFFLSPTLLHFSIHVLSENIYIPLFLWLFLWSIKFIEVSSSIPSPSLTYPTQRSLVIMLACLLWLMYLTRAEAFIYLWSIWIISLTMLCKRILSFRQFFKLWTIFFISFGIFISPYLLHLHNITGEWGLTNKWASNLRQAELRGRDKMDDIGFEKAVAELTPDNQHLIAGFAWGMPYDTPSIEWSLWAFISKDPWSFLIRIWENQSKLIQRNLPEIFLWKSPKLYSDTSQTFFYHNTFFLIFCIIPLIILLYGGYSLFRKQKVFFYTSIAFFIPALVFFTLFFTLNRYFLIFLPLMLVAFCFGLQTIWSKFQKRLQIIPLILFVNIILLYWLSIKVYHSIESPKDEYYSLKQEAGEWLKEYQNNEYITKCAILSDSRKADKCTQDLKLKIMERFPIVTYYSWAEYRWITPYTQNISDIHEYAQYNGLNILVVDTMDFQTYRPQLQKYLSETPKGFIQLKEFSNPKGQKVILYWVEK